jgi:excisionase family DNA binding protein
MFDNRALTPAQVAGHLQVSEGRVLRWLTAGQLRGLKFGGQWWTSTLALAAFLEAHANHPPPGPLAAGGNGRLYPFERRGRG